MKQFIFLIFIFGSFLKGYSQCQTWNDSPNKDQLESAHVLYRGIIGTKSMQELEQLSPGDIELCFENWKIAYDGAPAADGARPSHYVDGRKLFQLKYTKTLDEQLKEEYRKTILRLYDEQIQCYKNESFLLGRKGYDMFYVLGFGYDNATFEALKQSLDLGGNTTEYVVMEPLTNCIVYNFQSGQLPQLEARNLLLKILDVADYNIQNNQRLSAYYETTKARVEAAFASVEDQLFDCEFFKGKLLPDVEKNPNDLEVIKYAYNKLVAQGCDVEDSDVAELKRKYEELAAEINAQIELERRASNPGYDAIQLQKEGNYQKAVQRYKEAIASTDDAEALAQFYYSIAFIETWQLNNHRSALVDARKALSYKDSWGKPYILIGNIYAKLSRTCEDDWSTRMAILAALDKYATARSIDNEVNEEATKLINNFRDAMPERQEGFMRQINEGDAQTVGCGIGETVRVRFRN
jgi:hypothetical protein